MLRTHAAGSLRATDAGRTVTLAGWWPGAGTTAA